MMTMTQVHVTRISEQGDVFGHTSDHCAPNGCNGDEHYFSGLDARECSTDEMADLNPVEIVEIGPSLGDCSEAEYATECDRLEAAYTEVEGDEYSVSVRPCRSGEAPGTYYRKSGGDLQILGYSLSVEDTCPGLREIQEAAFAKFCA
jgi:hypothetical protein